MRLAEKSEPQLSMITQVHPNEGETAVTTDEEANRYAIIAAREGLNAYPNTRRVPEAGYCTACGKLLWKAKSAPYNTLLDLAHVLLIQRYVPKPPSPPQIAYCAAFYCKGNDECARETKVKLTAIHVKAMAKWMPTPPVKPSKEMPVDAIVVREDTPDSPAPPPVRTAVDAIVVKEETPSSPAPKPSGEPRPSK
jgi:hypothetical protein